MPSLFPYRAEFIELQAVEKNNVYYESGGANQVWKNYQTKSNYDNNAPAPQSLDNYHIMASDDNSGGVYLVRRFVTTFGNYAYDAYGYNWTGTTRRDSQSWTSDGKSRDGEQTGNTTNRKKYSGLLFTSVKDWKPANDGKNFQYFGWWSVNLPIFDESDTSGIQAYKDTGDTTSALNAEELGLNKIITNVYVDKSTPPNLKITWNIDGTSVPKMYSVIMNGTTTLLSSAEIVHDNFNFNKGFATYTWGQLDTRSSGLLGDLKTVDITLSYIPSDDLTNKQGEGTIQVDSSGAFSPSSLIVGKHYINVIRGTGEGDDGYSDNVDESAATDSNITVNICDLLTATYKVTSTQLQAFGNFLWSADLSDNIRLINNSPIENVVSVKAMPISLDGTESTINLGNVNSGVSGIKVNNSYVKKTIGTIKVPRIYNNFVDFEYTTIDLYLPLIGTITDLNPKEVVGYEITLKYCFDVISGDCLAILYNNRGGGTNCIGVYKGNCSIDIPLTASNRAQLQAGYITDAVGGVISAVSGQPIGVLMSGLSAISRQHVNKSSGSVSGVTAQGLPTSAYLTIVENATQIPSNYAETYGRPCNLTKKLSKVSGFTVVDKNIRLSNINCTYEEKEELRKLLSEGVIF